MPAKSKAQANLMRAAEHGATFPKAKKIRASMSPSAMHDFAAKSKGLPAHVQNASHPARNLGKHLSKPKRMRDTVSHSYKDGY